MFQQNLSEDNFDFHLGRVQFNDEPCLDEFQKLAISFFIQPSTCDWVD